MSINNYVLAIRKLVESLFKTPLDSVLTETKAIVEQVLLLTLGYLLVCIVLYKIISLIRFPDHFKRVLIVTAHPDDECMFFAPTILSLTRRKDCQVYLLCLSKGNYEKKGDLRRAELWSSCRVLEMRPENVIMCSVTDLQDDPAVEWKAETVSRIVQKYVSSLGIQAVITFDQDGVSRHSNHCHIYYAVASLFLAKSIQESGELELLFQGQLTYYFLPDCRLFTLETVNVFRKYLLVFDLPTTLLFSTYWYVASSQTDIPQITIYILFQVHLAVAGLFDHKECDEAALVAVVVVPLFVHLL